jgi:type IV pilus assembly protein PilE
MLMIGFHDKDKTHQMVGFTLIELLIVVAIISIIAGIGVPMYNGYIQSSKESVAKNSLKSISLLQTDYYSENNKYLTNGVNSSQHINTKLFNGKKTLNEQGDYNYFIRSYSGGYRAYAYPKNRNSSLEKYCVDHNDRITNSC